MLIAAGLVECTINDDDYGNEFITLELSLGEDNYLIYDDNSWNVIPERYFRLH